MRQDIVTYDSYFADNENLNEVIPDVVAELSSGSARIREQLEVYQPQKDKCLDDLSVLYEKLNYLEAEKARQVRATRAMLGLARRMTLHIEMKAASPAFYCS